MTRALSTYLLRLLALIGGMVMPTRAALNNRLAIDHLGFMGAPEEGINHCRAFGAALIAVGVVLIRRF